VNRQNESINRGGCRIKGSNGEVVKRDRKEIIEIKRKGAFMKWGG